MDKDKQKKIEYLKSIVSSFKGRRILVLGDLMVDEYIWGESSRLSPEAPVPVVLSKREEKIPGGAFNVVNNLYDLGAEVYVAGFIGDDQHGQYIQKFLQKKAIRTDGIFTRKSFPTILKTRILAGAQQVVRLDREIIRYMTEKELEEVSTYLESVIESLDGIIISDYAKGMVDARLIKRLARINRERKVPVAVDPQVKHFFDYKGVFTLTPNHHEAGGAFGKPLDTEEAIVDAGFKLVKKLKSDSLLITRGKDGMTLFFPDNRFFHIPTVAKKVFDVTGAGDTVISVLLVAAVCGASLYDAAILANIAAGYVVGEVGTATISASILQKIIREEYLV